MEGILALLVPFGFFALVFAIVYINRTAKHREKMGMIEKGFTPEEVARSFNETYNDSTSNSMLRNALLFIGAGIGVLIGYGLTQVTPIPHTLAYVTCGFLFGGIGMLAAYLIEARRTDDDAHDDA